MKLTRVGILHGGPSSEYEVSLKTAQTIKKHLPVHYEAIDIFVDKKGKWHVHGTEKTPHDALKHLDVVFNAMHGEYGEDGQVQSILETFNIPFTGSGKIASALAMNKALSKKIFTRAGIKTPLHAILKKDEVTQAKLHEIYRSLPFPLIVKPADKGSSIGLSLVKSIHALADALEKVFTTTDTALLEEYITGKEATVGVIEAFRDQPLYALLPIEICIVKDGIFDYDAKYSGKTKEICPGNFTEKEKRELEKLAKKAHEILGLRHYSRSDFIVSPRRGIYILETNSLPGMTEESLVPKALSAVGTPLSHFLDHLISLAIKR